MQRIDSYPYGFNGKEKDDEGMGGGGSTYDYGFRIYNPNLGRFLSVDPLTKSYPWYTPYQFAGNKPISCSDLDGAEEDLRIFATKVFGNTTEQFVFDYQNVTMEDYQNLAVMMGMGADEGATLFWMISGNNKANVELVVTDGMVTGYRALKWLKKFSLK